MDTSIEGKPVRHMKVGLILFGSITVVLGLLCLLMVPAALLGSFMKVKGQEPTPLSLMLPIVLVYVLIAGIDITLGIGSILLKRWARSLLFLWSLFWLICGVFSLASFPFILGNMDSAFAQNGTKLPPGFVTGFKIAMFLFMGVFYVILPGAFAWFYGLRDTRLTCELRHPAPSWTDRCPATVLALVLLAAACALFLPLILLYAPVFPLFGYFLTGFPAVLLILILAVIHGWAAWGMYHLNSKAWWTGLGVSLFLMMSYIVTFSLTGLMEFYRHMDLPVQTMNILEANPLLKNHGVGLAGLLYLLPYAGLMLHVRRYFRAAVS